MTLEDFLDRDAEQAVEDALTEWGMDEDITLGCVAKFMIQASRIMGDIDPVAHAYPPAELLDHVMNDDDDAIIDVYTMMAGKCARYAGLDPDDFNSDVHDEMFAEFDEAIGVLQAAGEDNYNEYDYMELAEEGDYTMDDIELSYWGLIADKLVRRLRNAHI